jgi:hypothetical protein
LNWLGAFDDEHWDVVNDGVSAHARYANQTRCVETQIAKAGRAGEFAQDIDIELRLLRKIQLHTVR